MLKKLSVIIVIIIIFRYEVCFVHVYPADCSIKHDKMVSVSFVFSFSSHYIANISKNMHKISSKMFNVKLMSLTLFVFHSALS